MMSSKGLTAIGFLLMFGGLILGGLGGPLVVLVGVVLAILCFVCAYFAKKNE